MIKVTFTYKTKIADLDELMNKFMLSADKKFASDPSNIGIEMSRRDEGDYVFIVLDIYYNTLEDYKNRTKYERSLDEWNDIWFNENNKHEEVSVEVFDILKELKVKKESVKN